MCDEMMRVNSVFEYGQVFVDNDETGKISFQCRLQLADALGLAGCVPSNPGIADAIASGRPIVIVGRRMSRVGPVAVALRNMGEKDRTYSPRNFKKDYTQRARRRDGPHT